MDTAHVDAFVNENMFCRYLSCSTCLAGGFLADLGQKKQTQSCVSLRNVGLLWIMSLDLEEQIGCTFNIRSVFLICRPNFRFLEDGLGFFFFRVYHSGMIVCDFRTGMMRRRRC